MKFLHFFQFFLIFSFALSAYSPIPSCFALFSLHKLLPTSLKAPALFKTLSPNDFQITVSTKMDVSTLQIPIKLQFSFDKHGKLGYKTLRSPTISLEKRSNLHELVRKTEEIVSLAFLESLIKEGVYTKIALTFPHLTFLIALEEILAFHKPLLRKQGKNTYEFDYFYKLANNSQIIARIHVNFRFNSLKIHKIVKKYLENLEKFEDLWGKLKKKIENLEELTHVLRERLQLILVKLDDVLDNKKYKGKLVEISAKKVAKTLIFDKVLFENFLKELKKHVLNYKFGQIIKRLKNSYCSSFNWYEELLAKLSVKTRGFAIKNFKFLYEDGPMTIISEKGFLNLKKQENNRKMKIRSLRRKKHHVVKEEKTSY